MAVCFYIEEIIVHAPNSLQERKEIIMDIIQFLTEAVGRKCSDIYLIPGRPVTYKINGIMTTFDSDSLEAAKTERLVKGIYFLAANRDFSTLVKGGDDDFSFALPGISRFRVCAYKQRGSYAAVIRVVNFKLPNPEDIGIPQTVLDLCTLTKGLLLVTGSAGSGKSTTLACIIDSINKNRSCHIITLEDPLEYLHHHDKSIVSQREITADTQNYSTAIRSALRQAPDVILIGEIRDYDTFALAMVAAEAGHLVISTMHTVGATNTINRIIDSFPESQQYQTRQQLALVLQAIVSQQLIPTVDQKIVAAFEVMNVNHSIRSLIRASAVDQIESVIEASSDEGMVTMDTSLISLFKQGRISQKEMVTFSPNSDGILRKIES